MESPLLLKEPEQHQKMEQQNPISNPKQSPSPWKLYYNPLYFQTPDQSILEDAKAQITALKTELELERLLRIKLQHLTDSISGELQQERRRREAAERVSDELGIRVSGHEAEMGRIRREIDEEKKMMRVAEVFREGKVHGKQEKPFNENPHIKRGIKGSVEFQRVVKAMCSNKSNNNKHLAGNYKLECQKAQLKILLKHRSPVRPSTYFIS